MTLHYLGKLDQCRFFRTQCMSAQWNSADCHCSLQAVKCNWSVLCSVLQLFALKKHRCKLMCVCVWCNMCMYWNHNSLRMCPCLAVYATSTTGQSCIVACCHGRRNRSGRPGGCGTNNLTSKNFCVHIISAFVNVKWTETQVEKNAYSVINWFSGKLEIRCHQISDFKAKCTKFDFSWVFAPHPLGKLAALPQTP